MKESEEIYNSDLVTIGQVVPEVWFFSPIPMKSLNTILTIKFSVFDALIIHLVIFSKTIILIFSIFTQYEKKTIAK